MPLWELEGNNRLFQFGDGHDEWVGIDEPDFFGGESGIPGGVGDKFAGEILLSGFGIGDVAGLHFFDEPQEMGIVGTFKAAEGDDRAVSIVVDVGFLFLVAKCLGHGPGFIAGFIEGNIGSEFLVKTENLTIDFFLGSAHCDFLSFAFEGGEDQGVFSGILQEAVLAAAVEPLDEGVAAAFEIGEFFRGDERIDGHEGSAHGAEFFGVGLELSILEGFGAHDFEFFEPFLSFGVVVGVEVPGEDAGLSVLTSDFANSGLAEAVGGADFFDFIFLLVDEGGKSELSEFDDEFAGGFLAVLSLFLDDLAVLGADASFGVVDREATGHDHPRSVFLGESAL